MKKSFSGSGNSGDDSAAPITDERGQLAGVVLVFRDVTERRRIEELNERQRMAVVLNKFEEMNYAEIAEVMGLSTKAVKSLLSRARGKLRQVLQPYVYMDGEAPMEE